MSASTQYTNLYNGDGFVYVTGPSGTFPATNDEKAKWNYPDTGFYNYPQASQKVMEWALRNVPDNGSGYATFIITVTNAVADNCNSLLVNGIAQTAGAIAMTVGDTTASATSIAAGINAYVPGAGPNYRAKSIGPMIICTSDTAGSGSNGDAVAIAFSGASTATTTDVGAGRAVGEFPVRIWLDVSNSASETVMGPNAVEITDWVTHRGIESARLKQSVNVVASTLLFERMGNDMTIVAQLNGTITDIISLGALDRDRITVCGNGVHTQALTASATIGVNGSASLATALTSVSLEWDAANTKWNEISRSLVVDPTLLRANGVAVPLQSGVFALTPAGGTATIAPGATGVSAFPGTVYEQDVTLDGGPVVLGASLEFAVDATLAIKGDSGTIYGNGVSIDLNGNAVNFSDPSGIITSLTEELALSGLWAVTWIAKDVGGAASVGFTLVPDFGIANTQFLTTPMYQDLSVTNDKIADATIDGSTKLVDDSVTEVKLDVLVRAKLNVQGRNRVRLSVPTAQVLTLNSVPIQIAAAPGAGKAILVEQVTAKINYAGVIYATNVNLQVKFTGGGEAVAESASFLVRTANGIVNIPLMYTVGAAVSQILENTALVLTVETGDPTAGTSDIFVYVDYSVLDL